MAQAKSLPPQPAIFEIPPLENGDRLSLAEFECRNAALPEGQKAELIEGVVHMPAALRFRSHGKPHSHLNAWLATYQIFTAGTEIADAPTVMLDAKNEPQPDLALFIPSTRGGQVRISENDYLQGAPELVAEISASTASIDLGSKKLAYQRNGVQEYLVWRVLDNAFDWFKLDGERYVELEPDVDGILRSTVFPGLWLDRTALLQRDLKQVLAKLQTGLMSEEHQAFEEKLQ